MTEWSCTSACNTSGTEICPLQLLIFTPGSTGVISCCFVWGYYTALLRSVVHSEGYLRRASPKSTTRVTTADRGCSSSKAPSFCFGILTILLLPHTPATSRLLIEEERLGALRRLKLEGHWTYGGDRRCSRGIFLEMGMFIPKAYFLIQAHRLAAVRMAIYNVNTFMMNISFFASITPYGSSHQLDCTTSR